MKIDQETIIYNTEDVANILKCSLPTARRIMQSKGFPLIRVGKNLKVLNSAFENWCMNQHNK